MKTLKKIFVFIVCIMAIIAISPVFNFISICVTLFHQEYYHNFVPKWISMYTYVLGVTEWQDFLLMSCLGFSWFFPPLRQIYGRGFKMIGSMVYRMGDKLAYSPRIEKAKSLMTIDHMDE